MNYIVVDLEATCWKNITDSNAMEIIEIGAVMLDREMKSVDEFDRFVKPVSSPILSDFCTELTSIKQSQVDNAKDFQYVFTEFLDWIGNDPFKLCSWGAYDFKQFKIDCNRHKMHFPFSAGQHINLKQVFSRQMMTKPCGMKKALEVLKIPLEGRHHRGIDDARNIAKITQILHLDVLV